MTLQRFYWSGDFCELFVKRYWSTFFLNCTFFKIKNTRLQQILPEGAGHHIFIVYNEVKSISESFVNFDEWWRFSKRICDDYGDHYVFERSRKSNFFISHHNSYPREKGLIEFAAKQGFSVKDKDE